MKRKAILSFATIWLDLAGTYQVLCLGKYARQRTTTAWHHLYVESLKKNKKKLNL